MAMRPKVRPVTVICAGRRVRQVQGTMATVSASMAISMGTYRAVTTQRLEPLSQVRMGITTTQAMSRRSRAGVDRSK